MTDPKAGLKALLAASTSFQSAVGAEDAEDAAALIDEFGRSAFRVPGCVIGHRGYESQAIATGSPDTWDRSGELSVVLYLPRPDQDSWAEEDQGIWSDLLGIVADLEAASGIGSAMMLRGVQVSEVRRARERESVEHWRAEILVRW